MTATTSKQTEATATETRDLDTLVLAFKARHQQAQTAEASADHALTMAQALEAEKWNARVEVARVLGAISQHPTMQTKAGKPVPARIAQLVGVPRTTILPLVEAGIRLATAGRLDTEDAPSDADIKTVKAGYKAEVARKQGKGKGNPEGPAPVSHKTLTATIAKLAGQAESFAKGNGLTSEEYDALETALGAVLVTLKGTVAAK